MHDASARFKIETLPKASLPKAPGGGNRRSLGALAKVSRELCFRLYTACEQTKRNEEARAYNGLVHSWPEIMRLSRVEKAPVQQSFDDME